MPLFLLLHSFVFPLPLGAIREIVEGKEEEEKEQEDEVCPETHQELAGWEQATTIKKKKKKK